MILPLVVLEVQAVGLAAAQVPVVQAVALAAEAEAEAQLQPQLQPQQHAVRDRRLVEYLPVMPTVEIVSSMRRPVVVTQ